MDAKKFVMAAVAASVTLFLTGFVLYGIVLKDFMAANSAPGLMKEVPDLFPLVLGEIMIAMFFTLILMQWDGITGFLAGAKAGAMLAFFFSLGLNLVFYATMNMMEPIAILPDTLANTLRTGFAGGVIGLILGRR